MNDNNNTTWGEVTWGELQNWLATLTEEQLQMTAIVFDSDICDIFLISEMFIESSTGKPIVKI